MKGLQRSFLDDRSKLNFHCLINWWAIIRILDTIFEGEKFVHTDDWFIIKSLFRSVLKAFFALDSLAKIILVRIRNNIGGARTLKKLKDHFWMLQRSCGCGSVLYRFYDVDLKATSNAY